MGYVKEKPVKVVLPSNHDYWAKVRVLKYGDLKKYIEYGGSEGTLDTPEKLRLSIVEWNLDDEDGKILPITVENIDLLQELDVIAIASVATPQRDERKKK